jgi:hypothetical protein
MDNKTSGLLLDGIAASSALDKSGEQLDIAGVDISSWKDLKIPLNFEHQSSSTETHQHSPRDLVGKVIYVRKIFGADDCENDRQREYWDSVRLPFIYIIGRLFDVAGHEEAQRLAAIIRDSHANNEPLLTAFSIEGSKLEVEKGVIKQSIMRAVAITIKECNATAQAGLLFDPGAPDGYDKETSGSKNIEDLVAVEKNEIDRKKTLGASFESSINPMFGDLAEHRIAKMLKTLLKAKMYKALTAGGMNAAPSTLVGGSALQSEHIVSEKNKKKALEVAKNFKSIGGSFDKSEFKVALKKELEDVSDEFVEHFADMVEDAHVQKKGKSFELIIKMEGLTVDLRKATSDITNDRPNTFDYHREGMDKPHTIQHHGDNRFSLDGHELTEHEVKKILDNVKNKIATIRYKKKPTTSLAKAEEYISELHSLPETVSKPGVYALLDFHYLPAVVDTHGTDTARAYLRSISSKLVEGADCRIFMLNNSQFLLFAKQEEELYLALRTIRDKLLEIVPVGGIYPAQFSAGIGPTIALAHQALEQTQHVPGMVYSLVFGSEGAIPMDYALDPVV